MNRIESGGRSITRSPELTGTIDALRVIRGLTKTQLGQQARVGAGTIYRIYHPEDPKGVSKERFAKVIAILTTDSRQNVSLLRLAGIVVPETEANSTFTQRIEQTVENLDLNPAYRAVLEEFILQQVDSVGKALRDAQLAEVQLSRSLSPRPRRRIRRLAS